jgi:hypothetical protein
MWQNMQAYQIITNNICPNTDSELLLVSRLDYIVRIFLCPQVIVVKFKTHFICKSTDETKGSTHC